jgi:transaldolase
MNATQRLHDLGQSLWLDNITRDLLTSRTLDLYISDLSVTGLISNPTIFDSALRASHDYDGAIRRRYREGCSGETLFFELAVEDLTAAADLFRPIHVATHGLDGWVSLEVSPLFANDPLSTIAQARQLHARAGRPNVFIKIPGTPDGLTAVEETIFAGIPVNVTLLFSWEQYRAAADAYVRGIERRVAAGLDPSVFSVASLFISRWDKAVMRDSPPDLRNRLGIAVAQRAYQDLCRTRRIRTLAASQRTGRPSATPVVGEHGHERSCSFGHPVRVRAGGAGHHQHHASTNPA